jgi:hypothetical protein
MNLLWQPVTLFLQRLLLLKWLIKKENIEKPRFASICTQAASSLAYREFSNSNAHGYPQEWWITTSSPTPQPLAQNVPAPQKAPVKIFYRSFLSLII